MGTHGMIHTKRLDSVEPVELESMIARCGGNALHLPAVHLVDRAASDLHLLTFEQGGRVVALALGFEERVRRLPWPLRRPRVLDLPTGPAIADAAHAPEVRVALLDYARSAGFDRLMVQPAYSTWLTADEDLARYRSTSITEFVVDLRRGEEAVLAAMHKTHRKNVRRAAKEGLRVEEDNRFEALLCLRDMQLASSERASQRAEGFGVRDESSFRQLHEHVYSKGYGHVLFAFQGDQPIAALAWLAAANRVLTVRSGSLPAGYEMRAMYLLYDELIRRAIREGMVELNAGGVPAEASAPEHPQAGLYEFKNGFGGEAVVRHGLDVPLKETGA